MPNPIYLPDEGVTVQVATEQELLDFANVVRESGGADPIPALLPSYPQNPHACLIANALNFGCSVLPSRTVDSTDAETGEDIAIEGWSMQVDSDELAEAIAVAIGTKSDGLYVHLPEHIGNAAAAFDMGVAFADFNAALPKDD